MGMAAILVMWPWPYEQNFFSTTHGGSIIWLQLAQWLQRRCLKMLTMDDGWRTRTTDAKAEYVKLLGLELG